MLEKHNKGDIICVVLTIDNVLNFWRRGIHLDPLGQMGDLSRGQLLQKRFFVCLYLFLLLIYIGFDFQDLKDL